MAEVKGAGGGGQERDADAPHPLHEQTAVDLRGPSALMPMAQRDEDAFPPGSRIARYTVLESVGFGGVGIVYACYDPDLDRKVAVKLLRPSKISGRVKAAESRRGRLLREAQALARLSHPNVVPIYEVGTFRGQVYLVMEFVEGTTLNRWLERERHSWAVVVDRFAQAGRGLAAAHAAGFVHRDFKPENVLVGLDGRVRVLDFGLATPLRPNDSSLDRSDEFFPDSDPNGSERLEQIISTFREERSESLAPVTREGQVMGTPAYMAPEQAMGSGVDARSDQFSLCVAMFEALYGVRPFRGRYDDPARFSELRRRRKLPGKRPPDLPSRIEKTILRGLSLDPADRFPSLYALLDELDPRPPQRRWWIAALCVSLLASVALGGLWLSAEQAAPAACELNTAGSTELWNPRRAKALDQRIMSAPRPYAGQTWETVSKRFDRWVQGWSSARTQLCEERREGQSTEHESIYNERVACFDRQLIRVGKVLDELDGGELDGGELLDQLTALSARLPGPHECSSAALMGHDDLAHVSPAEAEANTEYRERIAALQGRLDADPLSDKVNADADQLARDARNLDSEFITAEALFLHGRVLKLRAKDPRRAVELLEEAALTAQRAGNRRALILAASQLVTAQGINQGHPELGQTWAKIADATMAAHGEDAQMRHELRYEQADLAMYRGAFGEAVEHCQTSLGALEREGLGQSQEFVKFSTILADAQRELGLYAEAKSTLDRVRGIVLKEYGDKHPQYIQNVEAAANLLATQARYDDALAEHRLARSLAIEVYGPGHQQVAKVLNNMAIIFDETGRYSDAIHTLEQARVIATREDGEHSSNVAFIDVNLGSALQNLGRYDEALARYQSALTVLREALGPDHIAVGVALHNFGTALSERGQVHGERADLEDALARFDQAEGLIGAALGPSHPAVLELQGHRARALRLLDRGPEALAIDRNVMVAAETNLGSESPELVPPLTNLSRSLLATDRASEALAVAQRAVALCSDTSHSPRETADARFALALAIAAQDDAPESARAAKNLARRALEAIAKAEGAQPSRREIQAWISAAG